MLNISQNKAVNIAEKVFFKNLWLILSPNQYPKIRFNQVLRRFKAALLKQQINYAFHNFEISQQGKYNRVIQQYKLQQLQISMITYNMDLYVTSKQKNSKHRHQLIFCTCIYKHELTVCGFFIISKTYREIVLCFFDFRKSMFFLCDVFQVPQISMSPFKSRQLTIFRRMGVSSSSIK